ncbi:MAG: protein translocase subunit SecD [Gammaproteobacteria bacterium]|nr:protein translocase subunit SecD [Gammaproteobacteria bacterium]MDH5728623.1 protein translocase subunit SecD [Gammaproteobacteria bacterium]
MNRYPLWKYLIIIFVIAIGALYALPNLYGEDPAVQVSAPPRGAKIDTQVMKKVEALLERRGIEAKSMSLTERGLLVRFKNTESQIQAQDEIRDLLSSRGYITALNLAPSTPEWLSDLGALPMYLGLDLRGGVHFLMEVDMDAAIAASIERYRGDFRSLMRDNKIRYLSVSNEGSVTEGNAHVEVRFRDADKRELARKLLRKEFPDLVYTEAQDEKYFYLRGAISENEIRETQKFALQQNITTLRNRVNELGVAEPVIQQQGVDRIVVQLPGVQDTARAKEILGATATLEFRMVAEEHSAAAAAKGRIPPGTKLYHERNGTPQLLQKQVMITGDYIVDASSGIDQQSGGPAVFISLDSKGGRIFLNATKENVGKLMAVVFIEQKTEYKKIGGETVKSKRKVEEVINVARIRERLGSRFQITGLDSTDEARDLALLLRAGALAAPIDIVEERTVGPSLGQDNIDQGFASVIIGFVLVLAFMAVYYMGFGLVANVALALNLVLIVAVLSIMQATLTLPGIAGIVLTVGMAVDANVLIFERIREELRAGVSPQQAIDQGYGKAFMTIADANVTTLIAAIVLFAMGSGPIKGFAITLSIGILTSMFTAIVGTRGVINLIYGGRRVKKLSI